MSTTPDYSARWRIFFLVVPGIYMSTLDGSIVNIALPTIMREFHAPMSLIEWVVMIYLLSITAFLLTFGKLSDIRGRGNIYISGLVLFSISSLLCAWSRGPYSLIGGRFLQSLGAAMIMACTPALTADAFPPSERGKAMGMNGMIVAAGLTTGPVIGGWLIAWFSWRAIFYINVPIGILAAGISFFVMKKNGVHIRKTDSFDLRGGILLGLAIGAFLLAMTHGHDWGGFLDPKVMVLWALSGISAVLFWLRESKTQHPILDFTYFRNPLFGFAVLSAALMFMGLFAMVFLMPFYLTLPRGLSVEKAGMIMIIPFAFLFVFSPLSGILSDRIGSRILCSLGMFLLATALFLLSGLPAEAEIPAIAWRLALAGIGVAIFISPNSATAISALPPQHRGVAGAIVAVARNLGMVTGIALSGSVFNHAYHARNAGIALSHFSPAATPAFMAAFQQAMIAGSIVAGIGVAAAFLRGKESTGMRD